MRKYRNTAKILGALFLTALVASLVGGGILEPIISVSNPSSAVSGNRGQVKIGIYYLS